MEKQQYLQHVEKVIESKSFGRSDTYANLLRYLVQCTLDGDIPKETTIASEIFGKSSFDPSQSTLIRVYVYNLRKKLKKYYGNEGVDDSVVIKIPKGGYRVKFDNPRTIHKVETGKTRKWIVPLIFAGMLLLSVIGFWIYKIGTKTKSEFETNLWTDLFESDKTTALVLGDLFVYSEIDSITGLLRNIRDPLVNSPKDFNDFKSSHGRTDVRYESISYTYQIRSSTLWVKDLGKVFYRANEDFVIRTISRFNPKELPDNNFIVIGMIKTLGIFKDFLEQSGCAYEVASDALTCKQNTETRNLTYSPSGNPDAYHTDYAVMAKVPGPNNNVIYLFGGIWDTATSQSLKNFTDTKLMQELEQRMINDFGEIPKYYKILFEVSGVDRTELSSEILYIEKIASVNSVASIK